MRSGPPSPPERFTARVLERWDESPLLCAIRLEAPAVAAAHAHPGQYLPVAIGGRQGYFALANVPDCPPLELLVKRGASLSDAMAALPVGASLEVGLPTGPGFPVARHTGRDILLLAAGSGIAPLHAVLDWILARRQDYGRVQLYYGQRRSTEFAYRAQQAHWIDNRIELFPVVSGPEPGWEGRRGHVQDALYRHIPDPSNAVAYLCGMKAMVQAVKTVLADRGLPMDRVFLNY